MAAWFDQPGAHLARYSRRFRCAEINSSFHRPHAATTYAKWRDSTPADFRFAVKVPRSITHDLALQDAREPLVTFLGQVEGLGEKRGPLLVQLPPSLALDVGVVTRFLELLRELDEGPVVCEPRHATWFSQGASALLARYGVSRVAADPPPVPEAALGGGDPRIGYWRLHGSPRKYWSRYDEGAIARLAATLRRNTIAKDVWCVFDNTASGAALENARELQERVAADLPDT